MTEVASAGWNERLLRLQASPTVTLVGASEKSHAARMVMDSLEDPNCRFPGRINIVNARSAQVFGRDTVAGLAELEGEPGLVWLFLKADDVLSVLRSARVLPRGVVVYASGFREVGNDVLEAELADWARTNNVPVFGPQSVGLAYFSAGLSVLDIAIKHPVLRGEVGVIAQSGGVISAAVAALLDAGIGLSAAFALGNSAVMDIEQVASHLLQDSATGALAIYAESLGSVAAFARLGQRSRDAGKPIVLLRGGATELGQRAAASHTGALATPNKLIEGIAAQFGIILVDNLDQMVSALQAIATCRDQAAGQGRIGVISNYGGANVIFSDVAAGSGLRLPAASAATRGALLPGKQEASGNPFDASGGLLGAREEYARRLALFAGDPGFDIIVYLIAQMPDETHTAHWYRVEEFSRVVNAAGKTAMIATLYRDNAVTPPVAKNTLVGRGIEDTMAKLRAITTIARSRHLAESAPADGVLEPVADHPIRVVTGAEIRELLRNVPVEWPEEKTVLRNADLARELRDMRFPLVAKAEAGVAHRASAGGVILDIGDLDAAGWTLALLDKKFSSPVTFSRFVPHRHAYFIGLSRTPEGLPVLAVGPGGSLSEDDIHFRALPLSDAGMASLLDAAFPAGPHNADLLAVLCEIVCVMADTDVIAIDINPLVADADGRLIVLDAKAHRSTGQTIKPGAHTIQELAR